MRFLFPCILLCLAVPGTAQTTYYSKSVATNFNDVNSWGIATDGSGAAPASISNANVFVIGNGALMVLTAPAFVQSLYIGNFTGFTPATASGRLTVTAGNSLTISKAAGNNATLGLGTSGRIIVNGGNVLVNGNIAETGTGGLQQYGGIIEADGNDAGNTATSVTSGTAIVQMINLNNEFQVGTFIITDPHAGSAATDAAFAYTNSLSGNAHNSNFLHVFQFGNGVSTDAGGNATNGFYINQATSSKRFNFGSIVINTVNNNNNRFVTQSVTFSSLALYGNFTITTGEYIIRAGKTFSLRGNLINNGILSTEGTLKLSTPNLTGGDVSTNTIQNISGNGVFRNDRISPGANFGGIDIDNINTIGVTFSGSGWNSMPVTVSAFLRFLNGKANIGNGSVITLAAGINFLWTSGGFINGTIKRMFSTATIAIGNIAGMFPFISTANTSRQFFVGIPTALSAGGSVSISYNQMDGFNAVTPFTDNGAVISNVSNDHWVISQTDLSPSSAIIQLRFLATGIITHATPNARITSTTGSVFGSTTSGQSMGQTGTPMVNKTSTTVADISGTGTNLYYGFSKFFSTAANGNWEDGSTWQGGVSPGLSCDDVIISHIVTVNTTNASCAYLESRNNLIVNGAELTVGCTNNNNKLLVAGLLNVNGGILKINGYLTTNTLFNSVLNQTGGEIIIDGNKGGAQAGSVPQGIPLFALNNSSGTFSGGKITIVDPHPGGGLADYAFDYNYPNHVNATASHTVQFGDGISTDAGNPFLGFLIKAKATSSNTFFNFGNLVINAGNNDDRAATQFGQTQVNNNFQVVAGRYTIPASQTLVVAGNVVNDGTLISAGYIYLGNPAAAASPNPQSIGGNGIFANALSGATCNITGLSINNSNPAGVTLNVPLTIGTALTFTNGIVNTSPVNLLTLGGSDAFSGSFNYTAGRINGPFKRKILPTNGARQFPVGTATFLKSANIVYTTAPASTGFLTTEWIPENPGVNGLPLAEGVIPVNNVSEAGYWRITPSGGLSGGSYTATFAGNGTPGISDVTQLVLLKRNDGLSPWLLNGTHSTASGTPANPIVTRSGITGFSDFGIGLPNAATPLATSWTGATDTDWFNAANWSNGVPGIITSVTIPAGRPRYPLVTALVNIKSLNVQAGAAVNLAENVNLIITGL
ncbi:MAG: hypothetical protein V4717_11950 [Bacteroidota bacterium]